jgi:hypothetical protein
VRDEVKGWQLGGMLQDAAANLIRHDQRQRNPKMQKKCMRVIASGSSEL